MEKPSLLIHACCSPCLSYPFEELNNDFNITVFWYNPNIHPFSEYERRINSLYRYQAIKSAEVIYEDQYNIDTWLNHTRPGGKKLDKKDRCRACYWMRLKKTAEYAKKKNYSSFTSTLLYSKYQYHEDIKEISLKVGKEFSIKFHYQDFRSGWKEGINLSKKYGLYRQRYCGCIFSEHNDG
ncbi:MAG: epoxyqueuosine reductase QueH [Spirochaetes bacterium]|nr:epoxyqueuosine reductase QueH [Spirochaetota bacterium]